MTNQSLWYQAEIYDISNYLYDTDHSINVSQQTANKTSELCFSVFLKMEKKKKTFKKSLTRLFIAYKNKLTLNRWGTIKI